MTWCRAIAASWLLLTVAGRLASAQPADTTRRDGSLRVFIDCGFCDTEFFRHEITFISHVRSRQDAQVHVLVTTQGTGGGGTEYVLKFIGVQEFAGRDDELKYLASAAATDDGTRKGLTQVLKLGLVRFAAHLPNARNITIGYATDSVTGTTPPPRDPWRNWVFRISGNGNFNGEASTKSSFLNGSLSASRITDQWKLRLSFTGSRNRSTYIVDDTTEIKSRASAYFGEGLIARSLGPHWTVGVMGSTVTSSVDNNDLVARVGPALEYDFFKYSESTRRLLTLQYGIDVIRATYSDTTVFGKVRESLVNQRLTLSLSAQQPWGSANIGVTGSNYLHDFSKNRLEVFGGTNLRLVKGLSFNLFGSYSRVRDQLSLAKGNVSTEDLLLRLRQLKTNYRYFAFTGLSYTFGSIFNNIVNPRFGGGGGGNFFFSN